MDPTSRELPSASRASFGPLKEAKHLHANGSASVAELKEFLGGLKGRSPQEVIGIVSNSMLIQSLIIATVATVVFMAVFTIVPYLMYGPPVKHDLATKAAPAAAPASETSATNPKDDAGKGNQPDAAAAAKKMGLDESKESDPGKNPLDKGPEIDNLLDGIDK